MIYNTRKKITFAFILTGVVIAVAFALRFWLYRGAEIRTPSFSPDGRFIVFSLEDDGAGLYRLPRYGGKMEQLVSPQPPKFDPSFFRDGRRIAFAAMTQAASQASLLPMQMEVVLNK